MIFHEKIKILKKLGIDFEKWTHESFLLAQEYTYNGVYNNTDRNIPQSYVDRNYELVEKRVALGGYRLADTISRYFNERNQALAKEKKTNLRKSIIN